MPARDVKAYVKRNKNDAADAAAICEAARRPTMRFVPLKSAEQQAQLMQHRARDLLMRQRTQLINAIRAHMAELGVAAAQGRSGIKELLAIIADEGDKRLPLDARASLMVLAARLEAMQTMIGLLEKRIVAQHRSNQDAAPSRRSKRQPTRRRFQVERVELISERIGLTNRIGSVLATLGVSACAPDADQKFLA